MELIAQLGGILIIAAVLASLTGSWLARGIARPIEVLDQAAQAVSEGYLDQAVPTGQGIPELARLSQTFNQMTASLDQANQVKNAFIADVTHELRTPLTVIKGTVETLEDGALDDLQGRLQLLASMSRETDRLIRLVNDLLVLTRADANVLQLKIAPLEMTALARSRCEHLGPLAEERGVRLEVETSNSPGSLTALGDADRLAQVLDNLLDNAIRHAPAGSSVRISVRRDGEEIQCSVSDQGPGIPSHHLVHIFERFYRVDASRDRKSGGAGLGLAIVKALVSAQGGRTSVQSTVGEGAVFSVWLPAAKAATILPEN
jgi:signal transduction histidine kinase